MKKKTVIRSFVDQSAKANRKVTFRFNLSPNWQGIQRCQLDRIVVKLFTVNPVYRETCDLM